MEKAKVNIYISKDRHVSQIITGFVMLKEKGLVDLSFSGGCNLELLNKRSLFAIINDKKVVFDLEDCYTRVPKEKYNSLFDKVDYYFKRSYDAGHNINLLSEDNIKKIFPLGLNYFVTHPLINNYFFHNNIKYILNTVAYKLRIKSFGNHCFLYPYFYERKPNKKNGNYILFITRLWDENVETWMSKEECGRINNDRIVLTKALKLRYGNIFVGGVEDSVVSRELCPDLVISNAVTNKKNYIKLMKKSLICITTTGLSNSTGWKIGEYVAASKAIVCEPLKYDVPAGFKEGINYLDFSSIDECFAQIDYLLNNIDVREKMENDNHKWYSKHGSPDMMCVDCLELLKNL